MNILLWIHNMKLKLFTLVGVSALLAACGSMSTNFNHKAQNSSTFVFQEPDVSPAFYSLNAFNYNAPPAFELALKQASLQPAIAVEVPHPDTGKTLRLDQNKLIIPTINQMQRELSFAVIAGENQLDVTEIDEFLQLIEGKARHYPPRFTQRQERAGFQNKLKQICTQLDQLANEPNASFDVLIRAFKANVMARNLDLGPIYTTKSIRYAQRILAINTQDAEANFWFGFSLSEGGGQREAVPYLDKAMKAGVQEAYLSSVNNYLALDQKKNAIQTLKNYMAAYPQESQVAQKLLLEIENNQRWNVWQVLP